MIHLLCDKELEVYLEENIKAISSNMPKGRCDILHPNRLSHLADSETLYVLLTNGLPDILANEPRLKVINSVSSQEIATDKIQTSQVLLENKIAVPDTLITDSSTALKKFVQKKGLAILKSRDGCGGDNHYILRMQQGQLHASISDKNYIVDFANENKIQDGRLIISPPHYAQEFISKSEDKNDEVFRTYVIVPNVPFATIRKKENVRRAEDSIINVAKGAKYSFMLSIPEDLISLSLSTANALGFEIGALDFVQDSRGDFYVLEANLDCYRMLICRKFKQNKDFSQRYDLDYYIAKRLLEIEDGAPFRK